MTHHTSVSHNAVKFEWIKKKNHKLYKMRLSSFLLRCICLSLHSCSSPWVFFFSLHFLLSSVLRVTRYSRVELPAHTKKAWDGTQLDLEQTGARCGKQQCYCICTASCSTHTHRKHSARYSTVIAGAPTGKPTIYDFCIFKSITLRSGKKKFNNQCVIEV